MDSFKAVMTDHKPLLARVAASHEYNESLQQELMQEISLAIWQALSKTEVVCRI